MQQSRPRPVIGVPTQTLQSLGGVSAEIPPSWVMSQRYILTLTAAGGTLYQDIREQRPDALKHDYFPFGGSGFTRDYLAHEVTVAAGSRLESLLGARALRVNSMHHQAIRELGPGLTATAVAPDGLIEALEGPGLFVLGVQWHPEALTDTDAPSRRLFDAFVTASATFREHRLADAAV